MKSEDNKQRIVIFCSIHSKFRQVQNSSEEQILLHISSTFINLTDRPSDRLNKPEGSRQESENGRKVSKLRHTVRQKRSSRGPGEWRAAASGPQMGTLCFLCFGDIMNCGVRIIQAGLRRNGKCSSAGLGGSAPARLRNNPTTAANTRVTHANVHLHPGGSILLLGPVISCRSAIKNRKTNFNICLAIFVFAYCWTSQCRKKKKKKTDSHSWKMLK